MSDLRWLIVDCRIFQNLILSISNLKYPFVFSVSSAVETLKIAFPFEQNLI